jgi:hypothetical protein
MKHIDFEAFAEDGGKIRMKDCLSAALFVPTVTVILFARILLIEGNERLCTLMFLVSASQPLLSGRALRRLLSRHSKIVYPENGYSSSISPWSTLGQK